MVPLAGVPPLKCSCSRSGAVGGCPAGCRVATPPITATHRHHLTARHAGPAAGCDRLLPALQTAAPLERAGHALRPHLPPARPQACHLLSLQRLPPAVGPSRLPAPCGRLLAAPGRAAPGRRPAARVHAWDCREGPGGGGLQQPRPRTRATPRSSHAAACTRPCRNKASTVNVRVFTIINSSPQSIWNIISNATNANVWTDRGWYFRPVPQAVGDTFKIFLNIFPPLPRYPLPGVVSGASARLLHARRRRRARVLQNGGGRAGTRGQRGQMPADATPRTSLTRHCCCRRRRADAGHHV
jgi:hypothetical protein